MFFRSTIVILISLIFSTDLVNAQFEEIGESLVSNNCQRISSVDMAGDGLSIFKVTTNDICNGSVQATVEIFELISGAYQQVSSPVQLTGYVSGSAGPWFPTSAKTKVVTNYTGEVFAVVTQSDIDTPVTSKMQIFEKNISGNWVQVFTYLAPGQDTFGTRISMNDAGDRIAVSDPESDFSAPNSGQIFVFERSDSQWSQMQQLIVGQLPSDSLGEGGLVLSGDGNRIFASSDNLQDKRIVQYDFIGGAWVKQDMVGVSGSVSGGSQRGVRSIDSNYIGDRIAYCKYDESINGYDDWHIVYASLDQSSWEEEVVKEKSYPATRFGAVIKLNESCDRVFYTYDLQYNFSTNANGTGFFGMAQKYGDEWFTVFEYGEPYSSPFYLSKGFGHSIGINDLGTKTVAASLLGYSCSGCPNPGPRFIAYQDSNDTDDDGIPEQCDIDFVAGSDCDNDGQVDFCQLDSDGDGLVDPCDPDDDNDGLEDLCDPDTEGNSDCNQNGIADSCDLSNSSSSDCNVNAIPDECEYNADQDCNSNGILDSCDILLGVSLDCSGNGVPDECEISNGSVPDCNGNGVPDSCDYANDADCNVNGVIDACDILLGIEEDCDGDGLPDSCYYDPSLDCDSNGVVDFCDIASGAAIDCDSNGVIDFCETVNDLEPPVFGFVPADITLFADSTSTSGACGAIAEWPEATIIDSVVDNCGLQSLVSNFTSGETFPLGTSTVEYVAMDDSGNSSTASFTITILNLVDPDCDGDGIPDLCEESYGDDVDSDGNGIPDNCEPEEFRRGDSNQDGQLDVSDCVSVLELLFGSQTSSCQDSADMNDDGALNIADTVYGLSFLFNGGPAPADPGPVNCAPDPTEDSLDCESYLGC